MEDLIKVTGLILRVEPAGEYDRRVTILTKERGSITAFVRGARKPTSRFQAMTGLFNFGVFSLYPGRSSYTIHDAAISNYFEELRTDYIGACYGMYFLEFCDFCARENNDEKDLLLLLYQSLKALTHPSFDKRLVRVIFELRAIVIEGEYGGVPDSMHIKPAAQYTASFIASTPIEKLFTFKLTEEILQDMELLAAYTVATSLDHRFKSLAILNELQKDGIDF